MTFDGQIAAAVAAPVVAAIVWLVRLEGRINVHDVVMTELKDDVAEIKADVKKLLGQK